MKRLSKAAFTTSVAVVFLTSAVLGQTSGSASQPSISVGGASLYVGMLQTEALARLEKCCQLSGSGDSFFIQTRKGPPYELLGAIWFKNGRVETIRRDRTYSTEPDTVTFALTLFRLLADVNIQKGSTVLLETSSDELSNGSSKSIKVRFPNGRTVEVFLASPDSPQLGNSVRLNEALESPGRR